MIFFQDKLVHFIGIGGIGMSAIAEQLFAMGIRVQGSNNVENDSTRRLEAKGIRVFIGQNDASALNAVNVVVISSAIHPENIELQEAIRRGIPVGHRAEMLAQLMRYKQGVAVAGTHGKTTTSSLISHLMIEGGFDPSCIVGGIMNNYHTNSVLGKSDWIVVEADESDGSFLRLNKAVAIVTSMDAEHLDYYKDVQHMNEAYLHFMQTTSFYGFCVVCTDHPVVEEWATKVKHRKMISYGFNEKADIRALNVKTQNGELHFDIQKGTEVYCDFVLPLLGRHNVLNALAAFAVVDEMKMPIEKIKKAFASFKGVERRFTKCGAYKNIPIYDDYGHHPEEIKATLKAAKDAVGTGKVIALFQPHRYSRFLELMDGFVHAFDNADVLFVMDVYGAGENPVAGADKESFIKKVECKGNVYPVCDKKQLALDLKKYAQQGDLIIGLGAGDISKLMHEMPTLLQEGEN